MPHQTCHSKSVLQTVVYKYFQDMGEKGTTDGASMLCVEPNVNVNVDVNVLGILMFKRITRHRPTSARISPVKPADQAGPGHVERPSTRNIQLQPCLVILAAHCSLLTAACRVCLEVQWLLCLLLRPVRARATPLCSSPPLPGRRDTRADSSAAVAATAARCFAAC